MYRAIAVFACVFLLSQCTTYESGHEINVAAAPQIKPGVTDKAAVQAALGVPTTRSMAANSEELWTYNYSKAEGHATAIAFIPYIGGFLPGAAKGDSINQEVQVYFKGNIVSRCWVRISSAQSEGSVFGGMSTDPTSTQTDCSQAPQKQN